MQVTRVEETTQPRPPVGCDVLLTDIEVRQAVTGMLVGAWRLTFHFVLAYRLRPLYHPGNLPLRAPDDDAFFWALSPSAYLAECSAPHGRFEGLRWHHYVVSILDDAAYEVVAQDCECQQIPHDD
jgi:hypothetical protein